MQLILFKESKNGVYRKLKLTLKKVGLTLKKAETDESCPYLPPKKIQ